MRLYLECNSGASGDMLCAALLDLFDNKEEIVRELNALGLVRTQVRCEQTNSGGVRALQMSVLVGGEEEFSQKNTHHHPQRTLQDILELIEELHLPEKVKKEAKEIYGILAEAESKVHGTAVGEVHFHELGMLDAVADVAISAYLINKLSPDSIAASAVNVGNGTINCAHGILPVPAPATAELLKGIPFYKSESRTELCTPTGAAILKYYVQSFCDEPSFKNAKKIGIGAGKKKLTSPNILRAFLSDESECITELSCNVDDMTGEEIAFATEQILSNGALECFVSSVFMKKNRPGYLLTVLCKESEQEIFVKLIFKHTSTIGIRKYSPARYTLSRQFIQQSGVSIKCCEGYGVVKEKPEFEDLKAVAVKNDISLFEARKRLKSADED